MDKMHHIQAGGGGLDGRAERKYEEVEAKRNAVTDYIAYQTGEGGLDERAYIHKQDGEWSVASIGVEIENDPFVDKIVNLLNGDLREILGKKPTQKELADYLGVSPASVSGYKADKKELMIYGLWLKKRWVK